MEKAKITITGTAPLLMHADNIDWADDMDAWQKHPDNKNKSKAGDDRTPPWRWIGCLNSDNPDTGVVSIPSEYVMRCIMEGAALVPFKKMETYKSLSQSSIGCEAFHFPLMIKGSPIKMADVQACKKLKTFKEQQDAAAKMGFSLMVKRAKIGRAKHVRVRPRFYDWSVIATVTLTNEEVLPKSKLAQIVEQAGSRKGLGDWRPGAPQSPGPFGTFTATVK